MLAFFSKKIVLSVTFIFMSIMFLIVMFYVNPLIDSKNGMSVISLQLSFEKSTGIEIIQSWGTMGIINFNQLIFADYIYAISYSLFFASLLSFFIIKKGKDKSINYILSIYLAFLAGFFDCVENTMELFFINNYETYSSLLFFIHSIVATIKWGILPIIIIYIIVLISSNDE